jgi:hypothetical protein
VYLLVKGVNHIPVPRGEHHGIGVAEKAIQDLSNMMRSYLTDSNLPEIYWDFVVCLRTVSRAMGVAGSTE